MQCEYCGNVFIKKNPKALTCSKICSKKNSNKKRYKKVSEELKWKRKNDPEFRAKEKEIRERYKKKNPEKYVEQFKRGNQKQRERYNNDPIRYISFKSCIKL